MPNLDLPILVVDDAKFSSMVVGRTLRNAGYRDVRIANNAPAALEFIEQRPVSVLIADWLMPEMDGPSMLCELRKRGVKTRIVFISGYAEDAFEKNLEGQTDFAFLPKPFTLKQLAEAVKEAIG